jgi:hypothetical protein
MGFEASPIVATGKQEIATQELGTSLLGNRGAILWQLHGQPLRLCDIGKRTLKIIDHTFHRRLAEQRPTTAKRTGR